MTDIVDLIDYANQDKPDSFRAAFDSIMASKVSAAIGEIKADVIANTFANIENDEAVFDGNTEEE